MRDWWKSSERLVEHLTITSQPVLIPRCKPRWITVQMVPFAGQNWRFSFNSSLIRSSFDPVLTQKCHRILSHKCVPRWSILAASARVHVCIRIYVRHCTLCSRSVHAARYTDQVAHTAHSCYTSACTQWPGSRSWVSQEHNCCVQQNHRHQDRACGVDRGPEAWLIRAAC